MYLIDNKTDISVNKLDRSLYMLNNKNTGVSNAKIRVIPDGPTFGSWKKGANGKSIEKGKWATKKNYREVGMILSYNIDRILGFDSVADSVSAAKEAFRTQPNHVVKRIEMNLNKISNKQQLTDYLWNILQRYNK